MCLCVCVCLCVCIFGRTIRKQFFLSPTNKTHIHAYIQPIFSRSLRTHVQIGRTPFTSRRCLVRHPPKIAARSTSCNFQTRIEFESRQEQRKGIVRGLKTNGVVWVHKTHRRRKNSSSSPYPPARTAGSYRSTSARGICLRLPMAVCPQIASSWEGRTYLARTSNPPTQSTLPPNTR